MVKVIVLAMCLMFAVSGCKMGWPLLTTNVAMADGSGD